LINMGDISFYNHMFQPLNDVEILAPFAGSFGGMVINVTWEQLQPNGPGVLLANNPIDQALAAIRTYNIQHSATPIAAKLRVWGGFTAPAWVKTSTGGPIQINATQPSGKHQEGTVGLFWTAKYIDNWRGLQGLLAEKYDSEPLIKEIAVTSCASNTDEPFISWIDPKTVAVLHKYGYSDAAQQTCLTGAVNDYQAWKTTWIDFTFNPFMATDSSPKVVQNPAFTIQVMESCASMGNCILSNHALNETVPGPLNPIYEQIQRLYNQSTGLPPVDFQTASPKKINWCGAISTGINYHAKSIELWPNFGGFTSMKPDFIENLANALANKTPPNPAICSVN
jgi:hypothetical protein